MNFVANGSPDEKQQLLNRMNQDVPVGVDWKNGARTYVANAIHNAGLRNVEVQSMMKPLRPVDQYNQNPAIDEIVHYMNVFSNAISAVRPPHGSRILDVACGGGWVSHYLSTMGYWTYGIDISEDFIKLARQRLHRDHYLDVSESEADSRFSVLDIEEEPLPANLLGTFDYVWLESCLHHFLDPIAALQHLSDAMKPDGVLILVEYENRTAGIKSEYMQVMKEYDTLERPYAREELVAALGIAGFKEHQFVGSVNGWFSPESSITSQLGQTTVEGGNAMNLALCAKQEGRLTSYFPERSRAQPWSFWTGFYNNEGGYRWSAPTSHIQVWKETQSLELVVIGGLEQGQSLVIYGNKGELLRVALHSSQPQTVLLENLDAGEMLHLVSNHAFCPKWTGSADARLLSFSVQTLE